MPEQKINYAERLKAMQNKFADEVNMTLRPLYKISLESREKEAVISVASQAEAIREALTEMYDPFACHPAQPDPDQCFESQQRDIDRYLLEHGYIEPKNEEDGK